MRSEILPRKKCGADTPVRARAANSSCAPQCNSQLKRQSQSQLQNALRLRWRRARAEVGGRDLTECKAVQVSVRIRELRMVEHIEGLHAEFGIHALGDGSGLGQRQVQIRASRTTEEVARQAIGLALIQGVRNRLECGRIEV